jgi:aminoglycoside phosphotransferase
LIHHGSACLPNILFLSFFTSFVGLWNRTSSKWHSDLTPGFH